MENRKSFDLLATLGRLIAVAFCIAWWYIVIVFIWGLFR